MDDDVRRMAERFEEHHPRLRAIAYRMLGSLGEADDAVQEAWLRLHRTGTGDIGSLGAWLTTVLGRVCLNILRARTARREVPLDVHVPDPVVSREDRADPEAQALVGDAVGLALLVVLDALAPAERLAFVLHDMFTVPFEDIAPMLDRTPAATRQLASRARRRVRDASTTPDTDRARQREVVDAFLAAARDGDFDALVAVLHPDVVLHADAGTAGQPASARIRGARAVAGGALRFRDVRQSLRHVLVNGAPGVVSYRQGRPHSVMAATVAGGRIVEIFILADPERVGRLALPAPDG